MGQSPLFFAIPTRRSLGSEISVSDSHHPLSHRKDDPPAPWRWCRTHYPQRRWCRNRTGCIEYSGARGPRTGLALRGRTAAGGAELARLRFGGQSGRRGCSGGERQSIGMRWPGRSRAMSPRDTNPPRVYGQSLLTGCRSGSAARSRSPIRRSAQRRRYHRRRKKTRARPTVRSSCPPVRLWSVTPVRTRPGNRTFGPT